MNHKKRLFKQRMQRARDYKFFHALFNYEDYQKENALALIEGEVKVKRIIKSRYKFIVKAICTRNNNSIILTMTGNPIKPYKR